MTQLLGALSYGSGKCKVTLLTKDADPKFTKLPKGTYKILPPDVPHKNEYTDFYRVDKNIKQFDQVWFPIEYGNNSRCLHMGNLSDGYVTVMDIGDWEKVYVSVIKHRQDAAGKYVGTIIVE